jgi:X-Pro dipeptidyl-peptidase
MKMSLRARAPLGALFRTGTNRSWPALAAGALAAAALAPTASSQQFVDGLAQPIFAGQPVISHNVWVEVPRLDTDRDGVNDRIRIQVRRPDATENGVRLPVVMIASPYSAGTRPYHTYDITGPLYTPPAKPKDPWPWHWMRFPFLSPFYDGPPVNPPYLAVDPPYPNINTSGYQNYFLPRGFIFVYAQSLGTGLSTGCPTIGGHEENLAMKAVIDWFNGRGTAFDQNNNPVDPYWTTGATTMIGTSYDGTLPIGAATLGVKGLKAIVPIAGVTSYYEHRRSNGGVSTIGDSDSLFVNVLTRRNPEVCHYLQPEIARGTDRLTGDYNFFWHERNMVKDQAKIRAAVFFSHGLNDQNVKMKHPVPLYEALRKRNHPTKIWLNQGGHGDGANSGARQAAWRDALNRFWSHYLFGVDNDAMDGPKAAVQRENGQWVEYADWPVPGARSTTLQLRPSGNNTVGELDAPSKGHHHGYPFGFHRGKPVKELIVDDSTINAADLVAAPQSPNRLVYQTGALTAPVHVSGTPSVSLRLSFNKPAAVVSAMLVDYKADGTRRIITRGWIDPQNRHSVWFTSPIKAGRHHEYEIDFDLMPHDYEFQVGSRIGLVLLSSDWEGDPPLIFTLRPPPGTEITVDTAASKLTLPVVGGAKALWSATLQ